MNKFGSMKEFQTGDYLYGIVCDWVITYPEGVRLDDIVQSHRGYIGARIIYDTMIALHLEGRISSKMHGRCQRMVPL